MQGYSKIVNKVTFPMFASRAGLGNINNYLSFLERSQYWNNADLSEYQFLKIKKLLYHANRNTKYYRRMFKKVGFHPDDFRSIEDLKKIPPLKKNDLQNNIMSLAADNYTKNEVHRDATGGSTGIHTPFIRDNNCLEIKKAIEYRCNRWAGWNIGNKVAYYWPAIQDFATKKTWKAKIKNALLYRSLMLYSGNQDERTLSEHYTTLSKFKPKLVRCFPNPLSILAKYIEIKKLPKLHIPAIISVGEPLIESHRCLFERVFGGKIYNCYVSRECGNMACECGKNPGTLHVNAEMVYIEPVEVIDEMKPTKFLVTDLTNYGMPFIRYQIEDLGVFDNSRCKCGINLPLIRMEAGRVSDFLISPYDNSRVSGCSILHHMIAEGPEVGQIQVIQDRTDHLRIKIVKSRAFKEIYIEHIDQVIKKIFKGNMLYDVEYVKSIPRERSNKYIFTKCLINEKDLIK